VNTLLIFFLGKSNKKKFANLCRFVGAWLGYFAGGLLDT
jgi:hypothetical protein